MRSFTGICNPLNDGIRSVNTLNQKTVDNRFFLAVERLSALRRLCTFTKRIEAGSAEHHTNTGKSAL